MAWRSNADEILEWSNFFLDCEIRMYSCEELDKLIIKT